MTEDTQTVSNEGQIRFWSSGPGSRWVEFQSQLDDCFENVNRRLLELCKLDSGSKVLDIGCGCGATSLALANQYGDSIQIHGADVSRPLLDHAIGRTWSEGHRNIQFSEIDIQNDSLEYQGYDHMVSRFGVMFFTEPVKAFANLHQGLKADGRMVFAAWSYLDSNPWFKITKAIAEEQLGPGEKFGPREPGPMAFADTGYVEEIVRSAGFSNVAIDVEDNFITTEMSLAEFSDLACNLGPAVRLMKEKNGTDKDAYEIRQAVQEEFKVYERPNGIRMPIQLVVCQASD